MARKLRKPVKTGMFLIAFCIVFTIILFSTIVPNAQYQQASELMNNNEFEQARTLYEKLGSFKDSEQMTEECEKGMLYLKAVSEMERGDFAAAQADFALIPDFRDSSQLQAECMQKINESEYASLLEEGRLAEALAYLQRAQNDGSLSDTDGKLNQLAEEFYRSGDYDNAIAALDLIQDQSAANQQIRADIESERSEENYDALYQELRELVIDDDETAEQARELIEKLPEDYEDTAEYAELLDIYEPYIGTYYGSESLGNAVIRIEDKTVYLETSLLTSEIEPPNLSAGYYTDEANNAIFTIADTNTITVIAADGGNIIYESYVR